MLSKNATRQTSVPLHEDKRIFFMLFLHELEKMRLPKHRILTMIPWLSIIESTYKPEPEHVAQSTAPFASHSGHLVLSPTFF